MSLPTARGHQRNGIINTPSLEILRIYPKPSSNRPWKSMELAPQPSISDHRERSWHLPERLVPPWDSLGPSVVIPGCKGRCWTLDARLKSSIGTSDISLQTQHQHHQPNVSTIYITCYTQRCSHS